MENLHPTKQLEQLLNLVEECSSNDGNYLFFLNNEILVQHFNNLIHLYQKPELSKKLGYRGLGINPKNVKMFEYIECEHILLEQGSYGYQVNWMSKYLNDFFDNTLEIQAVVDEGSQDE